MDAQAVAGQWTANAIEKCRQDPELAALEAAGELCIECMCPHPCICENQQTVQAMRKWYESHCVGRLGSLSVLVEPKLIGSWGRDMDGLMTGLLKIARRDYEAEISRLRKENRELATWLKSLEGLSR